MTPATVDEALHNYREANRCVGVARKAAEAASKKAEELWDRVQHLSKLEQTAEDTLLLLARTEK